MVYFQTKNPNLVKFWMASEWKMLVYFLAICSILQPFGIFLPFGNVVEIWYIFPHFGTLYLKNLATLLSWLGSSLFLLVERITLMTYLLLTAI
jgi:hypothetical protein